MQLTSNLAGYGNALATPAVSLVLQAETVSLQNQTSGQFFVGSLVLRVADFYGSTVVSDNSTSLAVASSALILRSDSAIAGLEASQGVLNITGQYGVVSEPGAVRLSFPASPALDTFPELALSVRPCNAGEGYDSDTQRCRSCEPGTFSTTVSITQCQDCPAGRFSLSGAVSCDLCPPGTFQSRPGGSECTICAANQYALQESELGGAEVCCVSIPVMWTGHLTASCRPVLCVPSCCSAAMVWLSPQPPPGSLGRTTDK